MFRVEQSKRCGACLVFVGFAAMLGTSGVVFAQSQDFSTPQSSGLTARLSWTYRRMTSRCR